MFSKIYLAVLAIAILVMAFFTYYSWSWLQSIGQPAVAAAGYEYHSGLGWIALWISVVALLILANAVLWATGRSWAIWTSLIYFSVSVVIKYFWLDKAFLDYQFRGAGIDGVSFRPGPIFAVIQIVLMAIIGFFDQFIVVKLRAKTYGNPEASVADVAEPPAE